MGLCQVACHLQFLYFFSVLFAFFVAGNNASITKFNRVTVTAGGFLEHAHSSLQQFTLAAVTTIIS